MVSTQANKNEESGTPLSRAGKEDGLVGKGKGMA